MIDPQRLRELAETLGECEWNHPLGSADLCRAAADELERLREQVRLLHDATIVLRNGMGGHNHWDYTQQHGAGCETCIMQRKAREEAIRLIESAKGGV